MTTTTLRSHDRWAQRAAYDVAARNIVDVYDRVEAHQVAAAGVFGTLGTERLIVRAAGPGAIVIGFERGPEIPFPQAAIAWQRLAGERSRLVLSSGDYRHEVRYYVQDISEWDWTMAEFEDFDFGLWVSNVKHSPQRQQRLFSSPLLFSGAQPRERPGRS